MTTNRFIPYTNAVSERQLETSYKKLVIAEQFLSNGFAEYNELA